MVGRVGVEPTTLKRTDLQSAAFADSLPTQINAVRWKQPQTPLRLSLITLFCLSILEEPDGKFMLYWAPSLPGGPHWWNRWDLNPQPFPCKGIALPIAPRPHIALSRYMIRLVVS